MKVTARPSRASSGPVSKGEGWRKQAQLGTAPRARVWHSCTRLLLLSGPQGGLGLGKLRVQVRVQNLSPWPSPHSREAFAESPPPSPSTGPPMETLEQKFRWSSEPIRGAGDPAGSLRWPAGLRPRSAAVEPERSPVGCGPRAGLLIPFPLGDILPPSNGPCP